ncbi:DoxX family protein [Streptomyces sp. NPDC005438]|uniref:DoxX family protein n=1 Tax=Streptomyces sp. NPDC005438 TaxID=3156880 RepID=UPI0033B0B9F0
MAQRTLDTPARSHRYAEPVLWTLQVLLALFFAVVSAAPKLVAHSSAVEFFDDIGWGAGAMYVIGVLELLGGIALVVPRLVGLSALCLIGLMIGAFVVNLTLLDGQNAATPLILVVPLAWIAWRRRATLRQLPPFAG